MNINVLNCNKQVVIANKINEARYKMTKAEQKLFLYCVGHIDNDPKRIDIEFSFKIRDFADFLELKPTNFYSNMCTITRDFAGKVVEFYDDKVNEFRQIPVLSMVSYSLKKGIVTFCINNKLTPYLIDLKSQFTQYSLQKVIQFKSVYSIRIFQLLNQWGSNKRVVYNIEKLRFMLNIEPEEYTRYNDFKRKILEVALKEINQSSSLKFSYQEIKTGRKITSIAFVIEKPIKVKIKEEAKETVPQIVVFGEKVSSISDPVLSSPAFNKVSIELQEFRNKLSNLGLGSEKSSEILAKHDLGYLNYVIGKSKIETRTNVDNKAGYLLSLINTYQTGYQEDLDLKQQAVKQENINRELLKSNSPL